MGLTQGPDQKGDFAQKTKPHCIAKNIAHRDKNLRQWQHLYSTVKLSAVEVDE